MSANPFAGLPGAKVSGSGTYFGNEFDGVVEIESMEWLPELNEGGQALVVNLIIKESNGPGATKDPAGAKRSWFQMKNKSFDGAVLEFLWAVLKCNYKDQPELAEQIKAKSADLGFEGLKGTYNGQCVRLRTNHKTTKVKKSDFTRHVWSPFVPETKAA